MVITDQSDEKELLIRLRDGDEAAFARVFNSYHSFLFLQAFKLTQDEAEAQDIVQDIFVNLWANHVKLDIRVPLIIYLSKSVRFGYFKKLRSKAVRTRYEDDLAYFIDRGQCTTDELLLEQELIERLKSLARTMPTKTGQAFILKHLENYTLAEIGEALNVSSKTVSNMLSQANKDAKIKLGMRILVSLLLP